MNTSSQARGHARYSCISKRDISGHFMESHSPMRSQDRMDNLRCFWIALAVLKFEVLLTCQSLSISIDYYWLLIKLIVIHKIEPGKHNIQVLLHFSYRRGDLGGGCRAIKVPQEPILLRSPYNLATDLEFLLFFLSLYF